MENKISFDVRGCAFKVHNTLGPGLYEHVYEKAMAYELRKLNYEVLTQASIGMYYESIKFDCGFKADLLINRLVIVEIKSVEILHKVHHKQLLTYLRLADLKLGLLINFNSDNLTNNIKRIVNNF